MRTASNPGTLPKTVLMCVLLGGCASIPRGPNYYGASEQVGAGALEQAEAEAPERAEAPRCIGACWFLSARNENYYEARVYISGMRVATLPGMMAGNVEIPIMRSMLDDEGCMSFQVKLYPDAKTASSSRAYSSRQCPVPGSRLELAIPASSSGHPLLARSQDWRTR